MDKNELFSITGLFDKPEKIIQAAEKVVEAGYKNFDIHTPYPVKGLDEAMKLKNTKSSYAVFILSALGAVSILGFMIWTSVIDYPQIIAGKNFFVLPAYIPITFEFTILSAAISAFIILVFFLAKLPDNSHPLHNTDYLKSVSVDKFGISIESKDPAFDKTKITEILEQTGAIDISYVNNNKQDLNLINILFQPKFIGICIISAITVFFITTNIFNRLLKQHPFINLDEQAKLLPQHTYKVSNFNHFKPVEGSVARGFIIDKFLDDNKLYEKYLTNPLISTKDILETGKTNFNAYCSPCHGYSGKGTDSRLKGLFPIPPNLLISPVKEWTDGKIYQVITQGQRIMPSYASQISVQDRWTIILYLRALQQDNLKRNIKNQEK